TKYGHQLRLHEMVHSQDESVAQFDHLDCAHLATSVERKAGLAVGAERGDGYVADAPLCEHRAVEDFVGDAAGDPCGRRRHGRVNVVVHEPDHRLDVAFRDGAHVGG